MRRLSARFFTAVKNNVLGLLAILVAWLLLALFFPPYVLPPPLAVLQAVPALLHQEMAHHLAVTAYRALAGFGLALTLGTAFGILAFVTHLAARVNTFMVSLQVIPGTILGIILLLALGIGNGVPIALVAILTLPTMAINIANTLAKKQLALEQYLISAGGAKRHLIRYVYLPALIPTFQSNISIGFGLSVKVVLLGEFIGSQDGIGYLLNVARIYFNMKEVIFYLVIVLLFTALFETTQSFLFSVCLEKYFYPG